MMRGHWIVAVLAAVASPAAAVAATGEAFSNPGHFMLRDGEALYRDVCAGCHMPDGEGATGAGTYPVLARNTKLATASYPTTMMIAGRNAMPSFARFLDDEQVAAIVNYIRTHFGNRYADSITPADVAAIRR
jgi:mono/diheme cytochrome c family protein